ESGAVLIGIYALFALAASGRSIYQLVSMFDKAPVAYILSAVAGVVYIFATIALAKGWSKFAKALLWFELSGVVVVGSLSLIIPEVFKAQSVWSEFGAGYACIPFVLPVWGLLWLKGKQ
ncbi:MAG: hypothetical protein RL556_19, partial [Actinomycetota bacterium]